VPCRPQSSWLSRSGVRVGGFWRFKIRARVASTFASPLWARSPPDRSVPAPVRAVGLGRLARLVGRSRSLPCVLALSALAAVAGVFSAARVVSRPCRSAAPPSLSCSATCVAWVGARRVFAGPCVASTRSVAPRARHALLGQPRTS
jgi:hypothetical protein